MKPKHTRLLAWCSEASTLRRFAFHNIWFWSLNVPAIIVWYIFWPDSFKEGGGVCYLAVISAVALALSALSWWQSTRVEERQIEVENND